MATLAQATGHASSEGSLHARFRSDVLAGLSQDRKAIPARWFYDHRGSELFEQITHLTEYYPTRTEIGILRQCGPEVARIVSPGRSVVEFGAGSATKTPLLLDCVKPGSYVPIDISGEFLRESCKEIEARYPSLRIFPIEADFTRALTIPDDVPGKGRLGFFPGSTIGNMTPDAAVDVLRGMRQTLGDGSYLLIGLDRIKDRAVLTAAYDDADGVTAAFNRNLGVRINRELDGTMPLEAFRHKVVWNDQRARIEMHLEAVRPVLFEVASRRFTMDEGETIHTENSHKYDPRSACTLLLAGGWEPVRTWSDPDEWFLVVLARTIDQTVSA